MRRMILAVVLLSLPGAVSAGTHRAGAAAGPRYAKRSDLIGVVLTGDLTLWGERKNVSAGREHRGTLGLVGELNWVRGKHDGRTENQYALLGGLRYTLNDFPSRRLELFGQWLGGLHGEGPTESFTHTFGLGADYLFNEDGHRWGLRFQYDLSHINEAEEWYNQLSVSLIYRFPRLDETSSR